MFLIRKEKKEKRDAKDFPEVIIYVLCLPADYIEKYIWALLFDR